MQFHHTSAKRLKNLAYLAMVFFSCTVDIGGIKYIGVAARSKKEAELKAARTALLAIQSDPSLSSKKLNASSMYTVIPGKKKVSDLGINSQETAATLKPKKGRFKKKPRKRRPRERGKHVQDKNTRGNLDVNDESKAVPEANRSDVVVAQVTDSGLPPVEAIHNERLKFNENDGKPMVERGHLVPCGVEIYRWALDKTYSNDSALGSSDLGLTHVSTF